MPSHSKKQHNFMEAIAHSPSFAKKVHIPQSVGKDYAAADKGKTFSKGGDMKRMADGGMPMVNKGGKMVPSFAADGIGKMAKGGMAAKMKMFEKSSKDVEKKGVKEGSKADMALDKKQMMKAGGRVRRMAEGGDTDMSMGFGDPFAKSRDYDKEKAQGADSLKRLKGFFGFGDKEESKPSMTMDRPSSGSGIKLPSSESSTTSTTRVEPQKLTMPPPPANGGRKPLPPVSNPESDANDKKPSGPQFANSVSDRGEGELSGDGLSPAQGFKPTQGSKPRKPREVSVEKEKTKVTASPGYKRSGATAEELERYAGPFRVTESANKMRKEVEDKIRDSKPGSMTKQMRDAPSISDLYRGQKSMGEEIGDALKSFRASIRGGLKSAKEKRETREAEASAAKGGQVKKMAFGGDTGQPMRGGPRPAPAAPMNPNSIAYLQSQYGMRPQGGPPMKAGGSVKKMAEGGKVKRMRYGGDAGMDMGQPMRGSAPPPPAPRGMPMPAAGPEMNPNSIAYLQSKYGMRPQGGPPMKAGGSVKKMAEGGFTREADGIAKKGKTQGKVVKMAKGGFVKNADGCAQRGKTKAFQVKMKNGGMC